MDEEASIEDIVNQIKVLMGSIPSMKHCRVGMSFSSFV